MSQPSDTLNKPASWIIKDRATGAIMGETFSAENAKRLDGPKFQVIPILEYLQTLNKGIKP